jgi:membrane fusion protein (multidrug efflux system)
MNTSSRRPAWLKWLLLAALLLAIGLGLARALGKRQAQTEAATAAAAALQKDAVFELSAQDVVLVATLELDQAVPVSGSLKALQSALIKARVPGELQGLSKREGEAVRAGEVLARIDSTEAQARVRQADQQAKAAQAQVAINQRSLDNNQALVRQGFISATALETTSATLAAAEANHQAALAALAIANKGLADTTLRSPINGFVAARLAQNGERVALDARILELVDLSSFELEAALAPADAAAVQVGQKATLQVEGLAQPVQVEVARINPSVQAGSRSVLVYLRVPAAAGMRQGLFAQGQIMTGRLNAPAVPLSAVRNDKPQPYVQLLKDGQVVHQSVGLERQGRIGEEPMLVLDGVAVGTPVLRAQAGRMREGTAVKLASAKTAP